LRETIRLLAVDSEQTISRFFAAMNAHDGDAAATLVDPEVEVAFGPEVFAGRDAVRELAEQEHPELVFETVPVSFEAQADGVEVVAKRMQRWRRTGEVAAEEELLARFSFGPDSLIRRVEVTPAPA
jgi:limonene-1,2-epoxide hydrolase